MVYVLNQNRVIINKAVAILIAILFVFSTYFTSNGANVPADSTYILNDGKEVNHITLTRDENTILEAVVSSSIHTDNDTKYQWQIRGDEWANIDNMTDKECYVSIGLLENMLSKDTAEIRFVIIPKNGGCIESNAVKVTVTDPENPVSLSEPSKLSNDKEKTEYINTDKSITAISSDAAKAKKVSAPPEENSASILSESNNIEDDTEDDTEDGSDEENPVTEYAAITINYVYADQKQDNNEYAQAFTSYRARISKGTAFDDTIKSPTIVGYLPFADPDSDDHPLNQVHISFDEGELQGDITYTVYYRPTLVNYTSRYYLQNIYDDQYSEKTDAAFHGQGYTGSYPPEEVVKRQFEGFTALYYEPETIAADGSTEFECYYERNYYLIDFDNNGGYGVDPIYVRYGANVVVPNPVKAGYIFAGWDANDDGVADEIPSTMPAESLQYKAIWRTTDTSFNVVFWYENADDDDYSYVGSVVVPAVSAAVVSPESYANLNFPGRDATHFTFNEAKTGNDPVIVEGDGSTTLHVYFKRNKYTVKFMATGVCRLPEHSHSSACIGCGLEEHTHSSACIGCGLEEHAHGNSCYTATGGTVATSSSPILLTPTYVKTTSSGFEVYKSRIGNTYYLKKADGKYYQISSYKSTFDYALTCTKPEHTHDATCNRCNKVEHHHSDTCYSCGEVAHTHNSNCRSATRQNCVYYINAKYDADITNVWNDSIIKTDYLDNGYVWKSSATNNYYSFLEKMPGQDLTMTATSWSGDLYTWYYYLELEPDMDTSGLTLRNEGGKTYYLYHTTTVKGSGINLTYDEDYFPITGYTQRDSSVPSFDNSKKAYLYYTINHGDLKYYNYSEFLISEQQSNLAYHKVLAPYEITKEQMESDYYPDNLEPGAYEFNGWYTTPECVPGTEFDWAHAKMPDGDVVVYANWKPVSHNITFYENYDDLINGTNPFYGPITVEHRKKLDSTQYITPAREDYTFVGWFYFDDNNKKRFAPDTMEISRDMDLFAEWNSSMVAEYKVTYECEGQKIAPDTEGYSTVGRTKTFGAKGGLNMYDGFQEGYFPIVSSHSILMKPESNLNEFTFEYIYLSSVGYQVRYVDKTTGLEIASRKNASTSSAVVTEKFKPIVGYIPESYYLRKAVSADEEQNVLTFYYIPDATHGMYNVKHMLQNLDGSYSEYSTVEGIGDLNQTVSVDAYNDISGYSYSRAEIKSYTSETASTTRTSTTSTVSGNVTQYGLEITMYYDRETYPYLIRYMEFGNDSNKLQASEFEASELYGTKVTRTAPRTIEKDGVNYTLIGEETRTLTVKEDHQASSATEAEGNLSRNFINYYYTPEELYVFYVPVCPKLPDANFGGVTLESEDARNTIGSEAYAQSDFTFKGWFTMDEDGKYIPVDPNLVTNNKIVPGRLTENTTFYAVFVPKKITLTIENEIDSSDDSEMIDYEAVFTSLEESQTYSYKIHTDTGEQEYSFTADANGNATVNFSLLDGEKAIFSVEKGTYYNINEPANDYKASFEVTEGANHTKTDSKANENERTSLSTGQEKLLGTTVYHFLNEEVNKPAALSITKRVKGLLGNRMENFQYVAAFKDLKANTEYQYSVQNRNGVLNVQSFETDVNGTATLSVELSAGEKITFLIAEGCGYSLTEQACNHIASYDAYTTVDRIFIGHNENSHDNLSLTTGNQVLDESTDYIFTNTRNLATITGTQKIALGIKLLLTLGLIGFLLCKIRITRKRRAYFGEQID